MMHLYEFCKVVTSVAVKISIRIQMHLYEFCKVVTSFFDKFYIKFMFL